MLLLQAGPEFAEVTPFTSSSSGLAHHPDNSACVHCPPPELALLEGLGGFIVDHVLAVSITAFLLLPPVRLRQVVQSMSSTGEKHRWNHQLVSFLHKLNTLRTFRVARWPFWSSWLFKLRQMWCCVMFSFSLFFWDWFTSSHIEFTSFCPREQHFFHHGELHSIVARVVLEDLALATQLLPLSDLVTPTSLDHHCSKPEVATNPAHLLRK